MRAVESVAGDDDVSPRAPAFCRLAEWLSSSTIDNDRPRFFFKKKSLAFESWRGIVLQVAQEEFHSRLSIFIFFRKT